MKHVILILTLSFSTIVSFSQEYLGLDRSMIRCVFDDSCHTVFEGTDSSKLIVSSIDPDKIERIYQFNENQTCDSIIVKYSCSESVESYLYEFVSNLKSEWVQFGENKYVSKKRQAWDIVVFGDPRMSTCKMMQVSETPSNDLCLTITFSYEEIESSVWKELTTRKKLIPDSLLPQERGCKKLFDGKWMYSDSSETATVIERTSKRQIEYVENGKYFFDFEIKWTNKCTYEMLLVATNDPSYSEFDLNIEESFTVHILEIDENGMKYMVYDWHSEYQGSLIKIE